MNKLLLTLGTVLLISGCSKEPNIYLNCLTEGGYNFQFTIDTSKKEFIFYEGSEGLVNSYTDDGDKLISEKLDMVVGVRKAISDEAYRGGHVFGNKAITGLVSIMFERGFTDMLSGYRVMSRRFVKSFPISSSGFEIETEIAIHSLQLQVPFGEIESRYDSRPFGSQSKLSTWSDGFRILKMIVFLLKEQKPFYFFGLFFMFFLFLSVWISTPIILTWINTGLVPRIPTALLSTGLMILAFLSITVGIVLDSVSRARLEAKRLQYLSISLTD